MRIAIIGAGGTGGYFGGMLARAGEDVVFLARGSQLEALRTQGLTIKSSEMEPFSLPVQATNDPSQVGPVDLVLLCVKTYDTPSAIDGLASLTGSDTLILPVQNGIDTAEQISQKVESKHVLGAVAYVSAQIESPGVIRRRTNLNLIQLGELTGGQSERTQRVQQVLQHADIPTQLPPDIRVALWEKFLFICAFSGVTALTRLTVGQILAYPETSELLKEAMREGELLARVSSLALSADIVERHYATLKALDPTARGSMAFDLLAGRRLEVEALNGTMTRLGKEKQLFLPLNAAIYAALKPYAQGAPA